MDNCAPADERRRRRLGDYERTPPDQRILQEGEPRCSLRRGELALPRPAQDMRTGLGALPVPTNVAEMVIAHVQPGLHRVYGLHKYEDEKRRGLQLWTDRLLAIVESVLFRCSFAVTIASLYGNWSEPRAYQFRRLRRL